MRTKLSNVEGAGQALREERLAPTQRKPSVAPAQSSKVRGRPRRKRPLPDLIYVPPGLRDTPIPKVFVASKRLSNLLHYSGYRLLGDLHGVRLSVLGRFRNCGQTTLSELAELIKGCSGDLTSSECLASPTFTLPPSPPPGVFSINDNARKLNPFDLHLTVRAKNILKKMGVKRLGDLDGIPAFRVLDRANCGKITLRVIETLVQRANAGEFDLTPKTLRTLTPFDLLRQIDAALALLPRRNLQIIALRFGGDGAPPRTLAAIGRKHHRSRERVRQVIDRILELLPRHGGPKMKALLDSITASSHDPLRLLTPERLSAWVPPPWPLRYNAVFYLRVIRALRPDITVAEAILQRPYKRKARKKIRA